MNRKGFQRETDARKYCIYGLEDPIILCTPDVIPTDCRLLRMWSGKIGGAKIARKLDCDLTSEELE